MSTDPLRPERDGIGDRLSVMRVAVPPAVLRLRGRAWLLYPLVLFIALAAWGISSPAGSAPDEDYHLISAWCAPGTRPGLCEPGSNAETRIVRVDLIEIACFKAEPKAAGNCPTRTTEVTETGRGNFTGYGPSGFYAVMGLFTGTQIAVSVILMRIVNALLYAVGLGTLLFFVAPGRRSLYMFGGVAAMVPLGMFTVASVNPSSWAITSATLLWASAVEFARSTQRRAKVGLGLLALIALAMAMAARADAAAYAGLAVGLAWVLTVKPTPRAWVVAGLAVGVVIGMAGWAWSLGSTANLIALPPMHSEEPVGGWLQRLQDLPGFYLGAFGYRGLGWLDTWTRSLTWVLSGAVFVAAIFWGLKRYTWRKIIALLVVIVVATAVPLVIATLRHANLEEALQPRYFLPLLILAVMIAVAEDNPEGLRLSWPQGALVALSLGIANANALHTNLRRYLTGIDGKDFDLNRGIEWWWPSAPSPMVVFWIGSAALLLAGSLAALDFHHSENEPLRGTRFADA